MKLKRSLPPLTEQEIQKSILDFLVARQYLHWRVALGAVPHARGGKIHFKKNPMAGFPDIFGVLKNVPGKMFAIEVKTKTGRLSEKQRDTIIKLQQYAVPVKVARSLEDVVNWLAEIDVV